MTTPRDVARKPRETRKPIRSARKVAALETLEEVAQQLSTSKPHLAERIYEALDVLGYR